MKMACWNIAAVIFLAGMALALAADGLEAQELPPAGLKPPPPRSGDVIARRNRERWENLRPEERQKLREIYQRLKELRPEMRERVLRSLKELRPEERRQAIQQAREVARLKRLEEEAKSGRRPPAARPAERREPGGRGRAGSGQTPLRFPPRPPVDLLPPELREKVQRLPPKERQQAVEDFLKERVGKMIDRLPPAERERIRHLPLPRQLQFLRAQRDRQFLSRVFKGPQELRPVIEARTEDLRRLLSEPAPQRPDFFTEPAWERWKELKPPEKVRTVRHLLEMKRRPLPHPGR
ncbi:MAG: DUF3106 domain-containing protein [Planctomycetes bacterium]|nr:DUF3106 domain-containing protein [Planctomycetota bacterium]